MRSFNITKRRTRIVNTISSGVMCGAFTKRCRDMEISKRKQTLSILNTAEQLASKNTMLMTYPILEVPIIDIVHATGPIHTAENVNRECFSQTHNSNTSEKANNVSSITIQPGVVYVRCRDHACNAHNLSPVEIHRYRELNTATFVRHHILPFLSRIVVPSPDIAPSILTLFDDAEWRIHVSRIAQQMHDVASDTLCTLTMRGDGLVTVNAAIPLLSIFRDKSIDVGTVVANIVFDAKMMRAGSVCSRKIFKDTTLTIEQVNTYDPVYNEHTNVTSLYERSSSHNYFVDVRFTTVPGRNDDGLSSEERYGTIVNEATIERFTNQLLPYISDKLRYA